MRIKITFSLIVLLLITAGKLFAQPGDPNVDPDVPITGIEILISIGGILGIKKLIIDKRKKTS